MSTPMEPQDGIGRSDGAPTSGIPTDSGTGPAAARWSDAQVSERSTEHLGAGHLPPVHASHGQRQPEVEIRDSAPTVQSETTRQLPVQSVEPQYGTEDLGSAPHGATLPDQALQDQPLRAQPMAVGALPDRQTVVAREHERFGGMKFGSAFFGWLTATGLAVLLLAILAAAGVAFGIATTDNVDQAVSESQNATGTAKTVGLVGAIVLLVILFVAYYCGGYVAGRMARFDGVKQGLGVWIWAIITSAVIAAVAAIAGAKYNVLAQLNLPRIPVDEGSVTTVGVIAIAAAILVALLGALLGGAVGTRYHRKVDAVGFESVEATR
jgi:hypothetical protein